MDTWRTLTTWRALVSTELHNRGEGWEDVVANTMNDEQMDVQFYDGFGVAEGCPFTIWTENRVYFPAVYDGSEWCASVPRHPNGIPTRHVGGE